MKEDELPPDTFWLEVLLFVLLLLGILANRKRDDEF